MKKSLLLLSLSVLGSFISSAQCNNGRFASNVFGAVTLTSNVVYGSNTSYSGSTTSLKMDVYQPTGDTATVRPLIIWVHGGSFIGGSKTDFDMTSFSNDFAEKGYVCASIDYRLGFFPIDSANAVKAVIRAVQDLKATIRYFKKDFSTANTYKIDTNNIFIGGSSAGAITALHTAYLRDECEIVPYVGQTNLNNLGGLTGNSGNPGYSTSVNGVVNLCGALAKYHWIEAGDLPFTVKYNRGIVNPGVPLLYLDGSRMLYEHANDIGVTNPFYTFPGAGHVPYNSNAQYMDTTISVIRDYLIDRLGCSDAPLQALNAPLQTATLYPFNACATSISENQEIEIQLFPNPSAGKLNIQLDAQTNAFNFVITDLKGAVIFNQEVIGYTYQLDESISNGTYLIRFETSSGKTGNAMIVFQK
jgi:Carboxylesterase family/Secretion system C-terminal sorting domain